jgi:tetratricopeptide (TPR) repeat protein
MAQIGAAIGREFSHPLLAAVVAEPEAKLQSALDRLMTAGLLFRQGVPPHATYLFKHALVQDAAYGSLLREPRRALHARIADTLEKHFTEIAENQPELLARHYTDAGLIVKAVGLWGKAGERSLARSAPVEATTQFNRALAQIADLPATPALRREQINLQVALIHPLYHVKGPAAPETVAAVERARVVIEDAEKIGEAPDDPLLLFSVLYGFWVASLVAFNGDAVSELATQFLTIAEKQGATRLRMVGHRLKGMSLLCTGAIAEARVHFDQAMALYDPDDHLSLATGFGQEVRVATISFRSMASWLLGYPRAALEDVERALNKAREIGQAATLMYALTNTSPALIDCGSYEQANVQLDELIALADEKAASYWKAIGTLFRGNLYFLTGDASAAVQTITTGIPLFDQREQHCTNLLGYHFWRGRMRHSANSMMLGTVSVKR